MLDHIVFLSDLYKMSVSKETRRRISRGLKDHWKCVDRKYDSDKYGDFQHDDYNHHGKRKGKDGYSITPYQGGSSGLKKARALCVREKHMNRKPTKREKTQRKKLGYRKLSKAKRSLSRKKRSLSRKKRSLSRKKRSKKRR